MSRFKVGDHVVFRNMEEARREIHSHWTGFSERVNVIRGVREDGGLDLRGLTKGAKAGLSASHVFLIRKLSTNKICR